MQDWGTTKEGNPTSKNNNFKSLKEVGDIEEGKLELFNMQQRNIGQNCTKIEKSKENIGNL